MVELRNAALVRRAVEDVWNQGKLAVADLLFATDYINHAGLITNLVRGPEAIKISIAIYRTAFPTFHITVDELTAKRDAVLLRWTARSRLPEAGSGTSATQGTLTGLIVCRCADGYIVESWTQWNQVAVLEQLGLRHRAG